jgi:DNA-directed RNA polymerase specialized sigma subunit
MKNFSEKSRGQEKRDYAEGKENTGNDIDERQDETNRTIGCRRTIYIKQNGKKVTVEVSEGLYREMARMRREEWRNEKSYKNHNHSLEAGMEQGCDIEDDSRNPETLFAENDGETQKALRLKKLKEGLKTLSDKQSGAIHKYFFLRMSYAEIANEDGVSKQAVEQRIQSALKILRKLFQKHLDDTPFFF